MSLKVMGDRRKNFKFNARNGGVVKMQEDMRKNLQNKRRLDRFNLSGDNRPSLDEWDIVCFSFENQALIIHSSDDIVLNFKNHPYLDEYSTYPEGYIQNASEKLKDCIKSAIDLLQQKRAIFKHIQYRFTTCTLTADKLPILISAKNDENIETVMDTSEISVSVASDENDIVNIADVFITQGTVDCALKIWSKLLNKGDLNVTDSSLFRLLIEFISFISSLRPSYFNLPFLGESLNDILRTIKLPLSPDFDHISNLLFFLYNIFDSKSLPPNFHSFILSYLIPAIQEKFHYLTSTLSDTHSTVESTIKFFMGASVVFKFAFECVKTIDTDQKISIYQNFKDLLIDSAKIMVREYPFISLNLSSTLADFSDFCVDILADERVYFFIIKTLRDSSLFKNSYRMATNLANKLEANEFENFLIKSNFFPNFAESLKLCKHEANRALYNILEIIFKRLPPPFIAANLIGSGLFSQICEHYFWGSIQDKSNFRQIAPVILSCEHSSRYIDKLLESDLLNAFFNDLYKALDDEVSNAICCAYKLLQWSHKPGEMELFKSKIQQAKVLNVLYHPDITNRGNPELEEKRKTILIMLHRVLAD